MLPAIFSLLGLAGTATVVAVLMNPILRRVLLAASLVLIALAHYYATWLGRGGLLAKLSVWLSTVIVILLWYRWYKTF